MSRMSNFNEYLNQILPGLIPYDFKNKKRNISNSILYMLNRTRRIFKWTGLPESVPDRSLELYLQRNGFAVWHKVNGELYVFYGGLGGEPNAYYMPSIITISNPYLEYTAELKIDKDCVVMPNDTNYVGLLPLLSYYCTALTENRISMNLVDILSRAPKIIAAPDDVTRESAEKFVEDIVDGEYKIIAENILLDGIRSLEFMHDVQYIKPLIEYEQYLKASMYNELGLGANYNMKRENLNTSETQMDYDSMLPLIDDMLECRKQYVLKVNDMYGTNISVELTSAWKMLRAKMEQEVEDIISDQTEIEIVDKEENNNVETIEIE